MKVDPQTQYAEVESVWGDLCGESPLALSKRVLTQQETLCGPIVSGAVSIIHGASKVGKSSLIMTACGHLANGEDFEGWRVQKPKLVLYIDQENPSGVIQSRLGLFKNIGTMRIVHRAWLKERGMRLNFAYEEDRELVANASYAGHLFDVVVIDSLYALNPPDDGCSANSAEWFERLMPMLDTITDRGGAVVILANLNKAGGMYGTNAQIWRVDYAWEARVMGTKKGDGMPKAEAGTSMVLENTASRGMLSPDDSEWDWMPEYGWRMR